MLAFVAIAIGFSSCREDIIIQTNLTPGADNIGTVMMDLPDSFYSAHTIYDDSIVTSGASGYGIYHALGWMNGDPYAGNTNARIYLQIVPSSTGFTYATNDVPDSAVLVLPYGGFTWGDTLVRTDQQINVYELNDTMSLSSRYYAFSRKPRKGTIIGTATLSTGRSGTGVISDSVTVRGVKVAPHLRVSLTRSFLDDFNNRLKTNVDSFAGFLRSFNGFYLETADTNISGRAMPYFLMNGTTPKYGQAGMLVYTHNTGTGADSTVYSFPFNSTYTAHFNQISRTYTGVGQAPFTAGSDLLMVQNQPGAAIDMTIKNLRNLPIPKDAVIVKASIVFTEIPATLSTTYVHPPRIYPVGVDANGVKYGTLDRYPLTTNDGLNFIDGTPRITGTLTTFTVNIPREFQQSIIQQKSELHLRINGTQDYPAAFRVLLGNKNNADYKFALKIIYSKQK